MVRHVILWNMKETLSDEECRKVKNDIKEALEALKGVIPGLSEINVATDPIETSNADLLSDSLFEDKVALAVCAGHTAYVKVKDELVVSNVRSRVCMDYEV